MAVDGAPFMATAFLLGQAVLANLWLLLGIQSWFYPSVVLLVLLSCTVAGAPFARGGIARLPIKIWEEIGWWSQQRMILRLIIVATVFLFVLYGIGAFVRPPVNDAEAIYMVYAKIIAASERVIPMPTFWSVSQIGLMGEMHFAALIQLSGVQAAKLFVWPISLAAAIMLIGVAAETGVGRIGQWFAVIILLASTAFTEHITDGKVDLFAAALGIAAFYWALKASGGAWRKSALAITGLCTGFAAVAKLPYVVALLPSIFVIVMGRHYLAEARTKGRVLFSLFGVAAQLALWITIAVLPHIIKNGLLFGAPFTPLIGPPELKAITGMVYLSGLETSRWFLLPYPLVLVFGDFFTGGGKLSFLLLVFLLLAARLPRAKPLLHSSLAQITMAALLGKLLWILLKPSVLAPRYILATLLMFIPLAAAAAEYAYQSEKTSRWLRIGVILFLILALTTVASRPLRRWPVNMIRYAQGELSECQLASNYCPSLTTLNRLAAPGARIYFAGYYGFWLRADLLQCRQTRKDQRLLASSQTTKAKWTTLIEQGFRYVIIDKWTHPSELVSFDKSQAPDWLEIENIWEDVHLVIYKIKSKHKGRTLKVACHQISSPAWDVVELRREPALN